MYGIVEETIMCPLNQQLCRKQSKEKFSFQEKQAECLDKEGVFFDTMIDMAEKELDVVIESMLL